MFGPPPFMGGLSFRFITSVTAASSQIDVPVSVLENDLLVLMDGAFQTNGTVSDTVPSGFSTAITTLMDQASSDGRATISYKIAGSGDAGSTLTGLSANTTIAKVLAVFRPNKKFSSVTVGDDDGQGIVGDPTAQTLAVSAGTAPLIALGSYYARQGSDMPEIDPRTFSVGGEDVKDGEDGERATSGILGLDLWLAWRICNTPGQLDDITVDMNSVAVNSVNILQSCYLQASL